MLFPVPGLPVQSSLCPVFLPMSCKSCVFYLVAPPPSVCLIWCIVYVWSFCCVYHWSEVLVLTLFSCSRLRLSCPVILYCDISDYLDFDLCLSDYDFCLIPIKLSSLHCASGSLIPFHSCHFLSFSDIPCHWMRTSIVSESAQPYKFSFTFIYKNC